MYGASDWPITELSSRFSMTITITCGGAAAAVLDAAAVDVPGRTVGRLSAGVDDAGEAPEEDASGVPEPLQAARTAAAATATATRRGLSVIVPLP